MFVPNWVGVYGSQYTQAKSTNNDVIEVDKYECYHYEMRIKKSGLKSLDQPTERCDSSTKYSNTSQCIARYIEDKIGCSMNIQGSGSSSDMAPCTLSSELNAVKNISKKLQEANANTIYELTGCLASCERDEYAPIKGNLNTDKSCYYVWPGPYDLHLEFKIPTGSYKEEEQYIIYDFNSFIGESGGILGLMLGYSVLSLYSDFAYQLGRFKPGTLTK